MNTHEYLELLTRPLLLISVLVFQLLCVLGRDHCFLEDGTGLLVLPTSCSEVASCFLHLTPFPAPFSVMSMNSPIPWDCVSSLQLGSPSAPQGALTRLERKPCHSDVFSLGITSSACSASHHSILSLCPSTLNRQAECHCAL